MDFTQLIFQLRNTVWGRKTLAYGELLQRQRRGMISHEEMQAHADKIEKATYNLQAALDALDAANTTLAELESQYQSLRA